MSSDFRLDNHGSIAILHPATKAAAQWIHEHIPDDAMRFGTHGVVIEHRFVADIVEGVQSDGLTVDEVLF